MRTIRAVWLRTCRSEWRLVTAIVCQGDAGNLHLPDESVDLICTSPPYFGLRSYQDGGEHYDGQIGDEATPSEYLDALITATAEWMRVLKPCGSIFVNLGDKYSNGGRTSYDVTDINGARGGIRANDGMRPKTLVGLPWRYALRCIDELGLILRAEIVWAKPNGLPESVTDRVRRSHEQVFHFVKQPRYYSAVDEVREDHLSPVTFGRRHGGAANAAIKTGGDGSRHTDGNPLGKLPGSVWSIPTAPLKVPDNLGIDHFAAYPPELVRRIVLGWSPREVCTACGEGRRPVKSTELTVDRGGRKANVRGIGREGVAVYEDSTTLGRERFVAITGYACACGEFSGSFPKPESTPGVVLDPFGGTGTTALVASCYGRVGISVDLSADYCRLARWRTSDPGERARVLGVAKPEPVPDGQLGMFDVEPTSQERPRGLKIPNRPRDCTSCGYRSQYAGPTCDRCGTERGAA